MTKDLRIFDGLKQEKILLVDNASYNFVNQVDNGIPIISFTEETLQDRELEKLGDYLQMLSKEEDLAGHNSKQFNLGSLFFSNNIHQAYKQVLQGYY